MNFSGVTFLFLFLPVFLIVYYLVPRRAENYVLVIGSVLFYAWGEPVFVLLFLNLAVANYVIGRLFGRFYGDRTGRMALLIIGVSLNTGVLLFGKSIPFIADIIENIGRGSFLLGGIPLGLGFYVLSCVSYIVDIFWNKAPAQKNFINYMVYISMFPKLLAGPVTSYRSMAGQIENRTVTTDKIADGIVLFVKGLGKKILLADNIAVLCGKIFEQDVSQLPAATAWLGVFAMLIRIYFDILGYTDMARGLGKMLGFQLPKNFRYPFMSRTVTEFLQRWHISFVRWVKLYIYNPLSKNIINKKDNLKVIFNIIIITVFVSVWHGFGKNFQTAAVFYLIILLCEKFLWGGFFQKIPRVFGRIYTIFITLLACALLIHNDFTSALSYIASMFGLNGQPLFDTISAYYSASYMLLLVIGVLIRSRFIRRRANRIKRLYPKIYGWLTPVGVAAVFILSTAFIVNSSETPFLYFMI